MALSRVRNGRESVNTICRCCERDRINKHRQENKELAKKRVARCREKLLGLSAKTATKQQLQKRQQIVDQTRDWRKDNPDKVDSYYRRRVSIGLYNHYNGKRRAAKKQATPKWADLDLIKDVYKEATYMQLHVDHIYPLQSDWVCGLHVWDNLQLLPASVNIAKSNRQAKGGL